MNGGCDLSFCLVTALPTLLIDAESHCSSSSQLRPGSFSQSINSKAVTWRTYLLLSLCTFLLIGNNFKVPKGFPNDSLGAVSEVSRLEPRDQKD